MQNLSKIGIGFFALTTFILVVAEFLWIPPASRFGVGRWVELSLAGLFLSIGLRRIQNGQRLGGRLYIAVGVFLVLVVLVGSFLLPPHAH